MYRYLDRPIDTLHRHDRLLIASMRHWVRAVAAGRCPCAAGAAAFRYEGVEPALPDFNMAMAVLNAEALVRLRFAPPCAGAVGDDEARLLALFATGVDGTGSQVRQLASQFVQPHAAGTLATAVSRVAAVLAAIDPRDAIIPSDEARP
ncbi:hypothetical protein F9288_16785 [Sphingomonas sp. CL5.1]|uniref:hypothetical protein n=1 Tax=Sphingomonas sp. CL5.1 TaxID=2653203 RepID=UPI001582614F|nr:hypothetical protein [Sphingomonas sp. CL5.1]QKS01099.1 hypothetical protein F9288_16785 [Sphingomonas sp. CL5.1]